jgi:uncharacterized protein YndB with AHSA1/START domain
MSSMKEAIAVADVERGTVLATVEIAAPPERVFEALTRSEDVLRWWGSEGAHKTTFWEADVRPGGKWRADGRMSDGRNYTVVGEFAEVDAPHRLAFTWRSDWDAGNETRVTYMLERLDGGTRLTLRHEGFVGRIGVCRNHTGGWQRVLGWLEADFRPKYASAQYFLYRLLPPRTSFMQDLTADDRDLMRIHSVYWRGKLAEGKIIAFGPVADPAGGWGMGLLRVSDAAEVEGLTSNDPAILADKGFRFEVFPMPQAVHL